MLMHGAKIRLLASVPAYVLRISRKLELLV